MTDIVNSPALAQPEERAYGYVDWDAILAGALVAVAVSLVAATITRARCEKVETGSSHEAPFQPLEPTDVFCVGWRARSDKLRRRDLANRSTLCGEQSPPMQKVFR